MTTVSNPGRIALALGATLLTLSAQASAQSYTNGVSQIPGGNPFNNSSTENVDFGDVDLDGDFDVVSADGGDCCQDQNRLWINQGGLQAGTIGFFSDETAARMPGVLDDSRDMDFVDFDADGDQDIYTSNTAQLANQSNRFLVNQGGLQGGTLGFFTDETSLRWINIGVNNGTTSLSSIAPQLALVSGGFIDWSCDCSFADMDNDGDLDLAHSTYGGAFAGGVPSRMFLNDGSGKFEEFNPSGYQLSGTTIPNGAPGLWCEGTFQNGTQNSSGTQCDIAETPLGIELGDLDADFDIDMQHGSRNTPPRVYLSRFAEQNGTLGYRDVTYGNMAQVATGGGNYENELGDFDSDGDLDIYGLNWSGLTDILSKNDGSAHFGAFTNLSGSGGDDNEGDFLDYNNDGNLDLFVCAFGGSDRLYRNDGPPNWTLSNVSGSELPPHGGIKLGGDPADIDNDGDYDYLVALDNSGANVLLKNVNQIADTRAPYLPHLEQAPDRQPSSVPTPVRAHVYDNASWSTTQFNTALLEYRVDGGAPLTVPMRYAGGQLFRGELPGNLTGLVTYQARSTDGLGNTGSSVVRGFNSGTSCSGALATYCTAKASSIPGCTPTISFVGTPSMSAGSGFDVLAGPVPGQNNGLFVYTTNGPQATPISNAFGFMCIDTGLGIFRIGAQPGTGSAGVCDGQYRIDFNAYAATQVQDPNLIPGAQVDLQVWYRDPPNPGAANLTDAGRFVLCP